MKLIDRFQKEGWSLATASYGKRGKSQVYCCLCEKDTFIFKHLHFIGRFICEPCAVEHTFEQARDRLRTKIETAEIKEGERIKRIYGDQGVPE